MADRTELGGRTNLFTRTVLSFRERMSSFVKIIINLLTSTSTRSTGTTVWGYASDAAIADGQVLLDVDSEMVAIVGGRLDGTTWYNTDINGVHLDTALQNYGAWTNYLLQSNDPDTTWTQRGTFSAVQDLVGADGVANTGWTFTGLQASGVSDVFQIVTGLGATVALSPMLFLKQIDLTGVVTVGDPWAGNGAWTIDVSLLTPGWNCVTRDHAAVTETVPFVSAATGQNGLIISSSDGVSVGFSGAQLNAGEISYPYGETTTTALSFLADVTTSPTPAFVQQDGDWAFKFKGTPHQTAQALKALFSFDSDATNYTEIQLNAANITASSVLAGVSNGAAVGLYSHTVDVQFETNVYYVAATKTLGIRSDDVSGDISAVAFVEDVLTSHPVITATLSTGNRNSANQAICNLDNDGVPVFFASKENAGW